MNGFVSYSAELLDRRVIYFDAPVWYSTKPKGKGKAASQSI